MNLILMRYIDRYIGIPLVYICYWAVKISRRRQYPGQNQAAPKRILCIKFWGVGNIAMLLPAVYALQKKYKGASFDLLTLPECKDVSMAAGIFDNIYLVNYKNIFEFVKTTLKNLSLLRQKKYDLVVDFEQFVRFSALLCLLMGSKKTIGFNTKWQHRHLPYTISVPYNNNLHMTKTFFSLAKAAGVEDAAGVIPYPLHCEESDLLKVKNILRDKGFQNNKPLVIIHIGTSENVVERRWPTDWYAELADRLIHDFGANIVFTGLPSESMYVKNARDVMQNKDKALDVSGTLDFGQYISLIKLSDLVISADTASVHLAACFSVPVASFYGPNTPLLYGPWSGKSIYFYKGLSCSPCITNYNAKLNKCRHPEGRGACIKQITASEAFSAIAKNYFDYDAPFRVKETS
jgi:ADP-heptose:LPS heptosyltransferase